MDIIHSEGENCTAQRRKKAVFRFYVIEQFFYHELDRLSGINEYIIYFLLKSATYSEDSFGMYAFSVIFLFMSCFFCMAGVEYN